MSPKRRTNREWIRRTRPFDLLFLAAAFVTLWRWVEPHVLYRAFGTIVPQASVYTEMCHSTYNGPTVGRQGKYDNFSFRRTTPLQYYTTAHVAYARGLDGVSAFNFVYYREHGDGERGPFDEPPFHVFRRLRKPEWLAKQPQHYILAAISNTPRIDGRQLPKTLSPALRLNR